MLSSGQQTMDRMYDHRFQRTDQWRPVYSWLESLDTDEVIKSNDVIDWLTANPEIRDHLYSRHSRYHLMHYIKKCHIKILKRKEKQGLIVAKIPPKENFSAEDKIPGSPNGNNMNSIPKDSELYKAKRVEAQHKYEILLEFEKQLLPLFGKSEN
ncbi:N-acetyl-gamma-glutamyl-phosphate reductase [Striga asiatica]|uniref:N-acetyl-gamma-glutamyl-phosphate reductase n=2 Tax=Striga TaxID=4169 RepID=A0A5A7QY94_STRAF|nr:N-acetyl-gamma-glutamyl-phosphate reductase [Striga asiatica]